MRVRRVFGVLALVGAALLGACATVPTASPLAELELDIRDRLSYVTVPVAGVPLRLMVDLGGFAAIALTTDELARVTVTPRDGKIVSLNAAGEKVAARRFSVPSLAMGALPMNDVDGIELVYSGTPGTTPPERNGYIGLGLLRDYLVVVDYPRRRLRLHRGGDAIALKRECGDTTFRIALGHGFVQSTAHLPFGPRSFIWDTGATTNLLRPAALPPGVAGTSVDDGPPVLDLRDVVVEDRTLGAMPFRVFDFSAPDVDGYLGFDVFARHRVCFDPSRGVAAARPYAAAGTPSP